MGIITSRLNLESLHASGGHRSHQTDEQLYSYSLNKNYFSNYFFMGGERFEVNDPDYLFGDSCDLNFLTCTKPHSLPYKQAQRNLLSNLNTKQKAINKVSNRVNGLSSPINILTGRHRQVSQSRKQDAQTQTLNNGSKGLANGPEPSQPLVMLINIRKETLRLVRSSHACNFDSDQNSLTNTASISNTTSEKSDQQPSYSQKNHQSHTNRRNRSRVQKVSSTNRHSTTSSHATTVHPQDLGDAAGGEDIELGETVYRSKEYHDSDSSSMTSNTFSSSRSTAESSSTGKSGYTSVRDVPPSECASDDDGEYFEDALNEPSNLSTDNDSERNQQKSLLRTDGSMKENCDIKIFIKDGDEVDGNLECDADQKGLDHGKRDSKVEAKERSVASTESAVKPAPTRILTKTRNKRSPRTGTDKKLATTEQQNSNRVYNIEFTFDAEVDCSIRVSYFCTRVVSSNNVSYKPLHATYKSKTYNYKRGLNQKFEQQEHSFRPYLFDEDLLIYKPLDLDGNYNSGAVFPIVIHCVALEGPMPRQSQSLVATVEKSQLDDSYSIKPLKQMIFVDGVQYILQDIYGIENKPLISSSSGAPRKFHKLNRNLNSSCRSLCSFSNLRNGNMNLSDTASINSIMDGGAPSLGDPGNRGSIVSNQYKSFGSENTFECVICMSEERDTMLLPCRHMCLCSSCAQSLRYQSNSCPICRCSFKAALNLRFARRGTNRKSSTTASGGSDSKRASHALPPTASTTVTATDATTVKSASNKRDHDLIVAATRRESLTTSTTPLLASQKQVEDDQKENKTKRRVARDLPDGIVATLDAKLSRANFGMIEVHGGGSGCIVAGGTSDVASDSLEMKTMSRNSWNPGGSGASSSKGGATASVLAEDDETPSSAVASRAPRNGGNKCSSRELTGQQAG